jgi:hypothetical protein
MIKKNSILSFVLLAALLLVISSCFLSRNANTADKGKRFPHDERKGDKQP